jgi:hypothetical protein
MNRKTLKNKIHKYICKKKDICCEGDLDKKIIIDQIIEKYKKIWNKMNGPEEYLDWINNDILIFIGYEVDMKHKKDIEGTKLAHEMDKLMKNKNTVTIDKITQLLMDVPLYFLLSFLGYATYKESF